MRGLHNLIAREANAHMWRWYAARVERRGRRHLLRVPLLQIDPDRLRVPYNFRGREEQYRSIATLRPYRAPNNVRGDVETYERHCNSQQNVITWDNVEAPGRHANPPRGYCQTCWNFYLRHADSIEQGYRNSLTLGRLGGTYERWTTSIERTLYPRAER